MAIGNVLNSLGADDYDKCLVSCFSQMGSDTREFVTNTIQTEFKVLIGDDRVNIEQLRTLIKEIATLLDGDKKSEGFQKFAQLVRDVEDLKTGDLDEDEIANIVQRIVTDIDVSMSIVNNVVRNESFIKKLVDNTTIIGAIVNKTVVKIVNELSTSGSGSSIDVDIRNQFVSILNNLINRQVTSVKNEIDVSISSLKTDITNQIQRIETDLSQINVSITNYATRDDLTGLRKKIDDSNLTYVKLENDVGALKKKLEECCDGSVIDISNNVVVINLTSQLTQINLVIKEIENKVSQFVTKADLREACEAACDAFRTALNAGERSDRAYKRRSR